MQRGTTESTYPLLVSNFCGNYYRERRQFSELTTKYPMLIYSLCVQKRLCMCVCVSQEGDLWVAAGQLGYS